MSVSWWLTTLVSGFVIVWLFAADVITLDAFPLAVSMWAVAILFIGMADLWGRE